VSDEAALRALARRFTHPRGRWMRWLDGAVSADAPR
jgi:hypothetical protein